MVIIILLSDNPDALDIEVWELGSDSRRKTRNTPTTIPTTANKLQINYAANVNPALTTPYAVSFDNAHPFATCMDMKKSLIFGQAKYLMLWTTCVGYFSQINSYPVLEGGGETRIRDYRKVSCSEPFARSWGPFTRQLICYMGEGPESQMT